MSEAVNVFLFFQAARHSVLAVSEDKQFSRRIQPSDNGQTEVNCSHAHYRQVVEKQKTFFLIASTYSMMLKLSLEDVVVVRAGEWLHY